MRSAAMSAGRTSNARGWVDRLARRASSASRVASSGPLCVRPGPRTGASACDDPRARQGRTDPCLAGRFLSGPGAVLLDTLGWLGGCRGSATCSATAASPCRMQGGVPSTPHTSAGLRFQQRGGVPAARRRLPAWPAEAGGQLPSPACSCVRQGAPGPPLSCAAAQQPEAPHLSTTVPTPRSRSHETIVAGFSSP